MDPKQKRELVERIAELCEEYEISSDFVNGYQNGSFTDVRAPRYFAVALAVIDREGNAASLCRTLNDAREWLADCAADFEYPREPYEVVNLRTGRIYGCQVHASVTLHRKAS